MRFNRLCALLFSVALWGWVASCRPESNSIPDVTPDSSTVGTPYAWKKPVTFLDDLGRGAVTGQAADNYKFRVPSLRNVEFTLPYMHYGRFSTLQQVLRHYATGIQDSPQLDPLLKQNIKPGIPMTQQEQNDIISFLLTLTDYSFISNPDFQPLR